MTLVDMVNEVINTLRLRNEELIEVKYLNEHRNALVISVKQEYMCKWQDEPFYAAGKIVFGTNGIGMTINHNVVSSWFMEPYNSYKKTFLFQWTGSGIYMVKAEDFIPKHRVHKQKSGEVVKVIMVSDLIRW